MYASNAYPARCPGGDGFLRFYGLLVSRVPDPINTNSGTKAEAEWQDPLCKDPASALLTERVHVHEGQSTALLRDCFP